MNRDAPSKSLVSDQSEADKSTAQYQNAAKPAGVEPLTPARALLAELVRRYWIMGIECGLLEIQNLAWFLQRAGTAHQLPDELKLRFIASHYGPYANNLNHLLNALDGSYLKAEKRIADSGPLDVIRFDDSKKPKLQAYLHTEVQQYLPALDRASEIIDGFESPFGMELLATVDWLLYMEHCEPSVAAIRTVFSKWPAGEQWAQRKQRLFDAKSIRVALNRLMAA